jgi:2-polyprenyl-3-methyl-5-hydroxy-6-metoxy-1,4-benzoquinol methylase
MSEKLVYRIEITLPLFAFDNLTVTKGGIISVSGWAASVALGEFPAITVTLGNTDLDPIEVYATYREDVVKAIQEIANPFCGFAFDFLIKSAVNNVKLQVKLDGIAVWETVLNYAFDYPAYDHLFYDSNLKRKSDIYGCGPPNNALNSEVGSLAEIHIRNTDRVLDFGCGTGKLVTHLRSRGIHIQGIELHTSEVEEALQEAARPHVTLYDGNLPLPFPDCYFDVVTATEVMEHIDNAEAFLLEIKRITKRVFIMTVPDATGIPRSHSQGVIPWHFLEHTHVNFFTQTSLSALLEPHWESIQMNKFGFTHLPHTFFANNLGCVCQNPIR